MSDEAAAQARLLAYYEARIAMLEEHLATLTSGMDDLHEPRVRRDRQTRITARENEIEKFKADLARLRGTIAANDLRDSQGA